MEYYTFGRINRIADELKALLHWEVDLDGDTPRNRIPIEQYKVLVSEGEYADVAKIPDEEWEDYRTGNLWGGRDFHVWFKTRIQIPDQFAGQPTALVMRTGYEGEWDALNPQFLAYVNGEVVQGLDVNHRELLLTEKAKAGDVYEVYLWGYTGMHDRQSNLFTHLVTIDRELEALYYNIKVPLEITRLMEKEDKNRIDILNYLEKAVNLLDLRRPYSESFHASVKEVNAFLDQEFYGQYCGHEDMTATAVGHTHIDVAWLWTVAQTREKTARSFSTVLELMRQYPEYLFMSSQPQLYKFLKEDHPDLYEKVKERIAEGRWEAQGGMWVEADCNVTSGESLVRQILYGSRFFEKEFGIRQKILWLPDVFGYSAALPQILKKSGIDYFMTTKISWNQYNKLPYDTFMWRGMDGTEILTHFISTTDVDSVKRGRHFTTYNGNLVPSQVMGAWLRYQQKDINNDVLISYGYGDGGGGPTREMLENGRRMSKGIPGCPKVQQGTSKDFFERLEKKVAENRKLPKWVGELYLEYHRGTYTSIASVKKNNRKSELLYQDVEAFSTLAMLQGHSYPQDELAKGWETILINQFHDILPGSSIKEVYEDTKAEYEEVLKSGNKMLNSALKGIAASIPLKEKSAVVFNSLSFDRSDVVEIPCPEGLQGVRIVDGQGNTVPSQIVEEKGEKKILFFATDVPAKGYKTFTILPGEGTEEEGPVVELPRLENQFFSLELNKDGTIASFYDKVNGRSVLQEGARGNILQAFEDKPMAHDAWDIDVYYQEKMWEVDDVQKVEVLEKGPVRAKVRITKKFLESDIIQDVVIYRDIPRVDFVNYIDWKERQVLLKAAFPVDVNTNTATYEIQYGNVQRPTHWNTSWDLARFEVVGHKWADLSEEGYGVSLLNDCKYGYDIKDSVMRLSLLKSAIYPNVDADREKHEFTYSIYPHQGDWRVGGTVPMAYQLNVPLRGVVADAQEGSLPQELSMARLDQENVIMEVVKKAEDSQDIIVRVYECFNKRCDVAFTFFRDMKQVWECDMLENNLEEIKTDGKEFRFFIKPYEIKTFKIRV